MAFFARNPLDDAHTHEVTESLQKVLVTLVDTALMAKQAHWNVFGTQFLSVHTKLDDVVASARRGSDIVAERMAQLGVSPDGRAQTLVAESPLASFPDGFQSVPKTLTLVCDRLFTAVKTVRQAIRAVDDADPLAGDHLIAIGQELEEHLWMLQAMEKNAGGAGATS